MMHQRWTDVPAIKHPVGHRRTDHIELRWKFSLRFDWGDDLEGYLFVMYELVIEAYGMPEVVSYNRSYAGSLSCLLPQEHHRLNRDERRQLINRVERALQVVDFGFWRHYVRDRNPDTFQPYQEVVEAILHALLTDVLYGVKDLNALSPWVRRYSNPAIFDPSAEHYGPRWNWIFENEK